MPVTEEQIQELQERIDALTSAVEEVKSTILEATGKLPKGVQTTIILLGLAAILQRPWLIALALVPYVFGRKEG